MKPDYKMSALYKSGEFYKELGEMMMNPATDIKTLADFAHKHGAECDIQFRPNATPPGPEVAPVPSTTAGEPT